MTDGIILINKPQGITSFSAVSAVRRKLGVKCGHSGTLDPLATGLLPILCGKATKLCAYITEGDKSYRATLRFGLETDTYDITGTVLNTDNKEITLSDVKSVLPQFLGKIKQIPPKYSAIKVGGTALYKLAREGKTVNVPEREITVYSIDLIDLKDRELVMDVRCSKGTYIRSLCVDIAKALGTVGTMSALIRTQSGNWSLENAVSLDEEDMQSHIISMDDALSQYPSFYPGSFFSNLLSNGCAININKLKNLPDGICRVKTDRLLGLGQIMEKNGEFVFKLITHL